MLRADVTDYGQTVEALHGVDAVVHLVNMPASGPYTPAVTFIRNTTVNANVFLAAAQVLPNLSRRGSPSDRSDLRECTRQRSPRTIRARYMRCAQSRSEIFFGSRIDGMVVECQARSASRAVVDPLLWPRS